MKDIILTALKAQLTQTLALDSGHGHNSITIEELKGAIAIFEFDTSAEALDKIKNTLEAVLIVYSLKEDEAIEESLDAPPDMQWESACLGTYSAFKEAGEVLKRAMRKLGLMESTKDEQ